MSFNARPLRPWLPAVIWLACIYSTLGVVRSVNDYLETRIALSAVISGVLIAALILIVLAALRHAAMIRPAQWIVGMAALAGYGKMLALLPVPAERVHLAQYGVLAFLLYRPLNLRFRGGGTYAAALVLSALAGWGDEIIQYYLPGRYFEWRDVGLNAVSALLGLLMTWAFARPDTDRKY